MPKLDRYLSSEIARSVFAALVVLGMVSFTGLFADLLGEMASGKVPPPLLLSQLGLRLVRYLPLILPLALLLGYLLALGSAFIWASYSLLTKRVTPFPTAAIGLFGLVSGLLSLLCHVLLEPCLLYTSPSPRDRTRYRMPSSA